MEIKCEECGKIIDVSKLDYGLILRDKKSLYFCGMQCEHAWLYSRELTTHPSEKHEKIKSMAEKIFIIQFSYDNPRLNPAGAWENAEDFYNYAKQKEEVSNEP